MEILGWILFGLGLLTMVVCSVWLLVVAFKESPMWGIGCMLTGVVTLIFVITHWQDSKRPFWGQLAGLGVIFLASFALPNFQGKSDSGEDSKLVQAMNDKDDEAEEKPTASPPSEPTNRLAVTPAPTPARTNLARLSTSTVSTQRVARPIQRRKPAPEPVAAADAVSPPKPAASPAKPEPEPLLLPGHQVAVEVEVVSTGEPDVSGLRPLNLRMTNHTRKTAKQVRMTVFYLGKKRETLKQWATSVYDPKPSLTSNATIEIMQPAFGMPEFTANIVIRVDMVRFEDGTEWQR